MSTVQTLDALIAQFSGVNSGPVKHFLPESGGKFKLGSVVTDSKLAFIPLLPIAMMISFMSFQSFRRGQEKV